MRTSSEGVIGRAGASRPILDHQPPVHLGWVQDRSCASGSDPVLSDFHSFDGTPLIWKAMSYDGDGPGPRVSHSLIQLEQYLYVLGGGCGNRSFNDLHRLDLFTMH